MYQSLLNYIINVSGKFTSTRNMKQSLFSRKAKETFFKTFTLTGPNIKFSSTSYRYALLHLFPVGHQGGVLARYYHLDIIHSYNERIENYCKILSF